MKNTPSLFSSDFVFTSHKHIPPPPPATTFNFILFITFGKSDVLEHFCIDGVPNVITVVALPSF